MSVNEPIVGKAPLAGSLLWLLEIQINFPCMILVRQAVKSEQPGPQVQRESLRVAGSGAQIFTQGL